MAESRAPHAGIGETFRSDAHRILSSRTAVILAVGAFASAASMRLEEPTRAASILDRGSFDGPSDGPYSFPSGHTAAAFAVAPVLNARFGPAVGMPAYLIAAGTALGRMEDSKHYLSDVVFGAAIGTAIGLAVSGDVGLPGGIRVIPARGGAALSYRF